MPQIVGKLNKRVIELLSLSATPNTPIFIGKSNQAHIKNKHPHDYKKYYTYITNILGNPDYIRQNPKDNSLEYVKEFKIDGEFVKVAIRVSSSNKWYVRSLYALNSNNKNAEDGTGSHRPLLGDVGIVTLPHSCKSKH